MLALVLAATSCAAAAAAVSARTHNVTYRSIIGDGGQIQLGPEISGKSAQVNFTVSDFDILVPV